MAFPLLFFTPLSSSSSSSSAAVFCTPPPRLAPTTSAITASPISGLHMKATAPFLKSWGGVCVITSKRCSSIVKAFSDAGGPDGGQSESANNDDDDDDGDDEDVDLLFDKLPLDSKLQLKLEQKLRMKFSKKIRLRRKKLVHKRRMRTRGRWPPSKVNRLKNV